MGAALDSKVGDGGRSRQQTGGLARAIALDSRLVGRGTPGELVYPFEPGTSYCNPGGRIGVPNAECCTPDLLLYLWRTGVPRPSCCSLADCYTTGDRRTS